MEDIELRLLSSDKADSAKQVIKEMGLGQNVTL